MNNKICKWCGVTLTDKYYSCDKKECVEKTVDEILDRNHIVYDRLAEI